MRAHRSFMVVVVGALFSVGRADLFALDAGALGPVDDSGLTRLTIDVNAQAPVRAFFFNGRWERATAPASVFSRDAVVSLSDALSTGPLRLGGTSTPDPFNLGRFWSSYNNGIFAPNQTPSGDIQTDLVDAPASGPYTFAFRSGGPGTVNLTNGRIVFLTDARPEVSGTLAGVGIPTYQRAETVSAFGAGTLAAPGAYRYSVVTIDPPATGLYMIAADFRQAGGGSFDGWISLYDDTFTPASPLSRIIGVDDDGGLLGSGSAAIWINLAAGTLYRLVVSTKNPSDPGGTYRIITAGPRNTPPNLISGAITFDAWAGAPPTSAEVQLRTASGAVVQRSNVTLGATGNFSVSTSVFPGTYRLYARRPGYAWRLAGATVNVPGNSSVGTLRPLAGDINGDNIVDGLDLAGLDAAFNTAQGEPGWNGAADLNGDLVVDGLDLAILDQNFNSEGDN